jgi:hypothetical protein
MIYCCTLRSLTDSLSMTHVRADVEQHDVDCLSDRAADIILAIASAVAVAAEGQPGSHRLHVAGALEDRGRAEEVLLRAGRVDCSVVNNGACCVRLSFFLPPRVLEMLKVRGKAGRPAAERLVEGVLVPRVMADDRGVDHKEVFHGARRGG